MMQGIPTFFSPNPASWLGQHAPLGVDRAAHYTTEPLRRTLTELVDFSRINARGMRLTVGAVNVNTGEMRYFDSRDEPICVEHIMASGALPPAFPAVRVDGEPYWDGGIYSNTPIEAVLDDKPRRDSVIFAVQVWNPEGTDPETLWQVAERQKDIQYASRARSHIARQKQIHHLRHIIRELAKNIPEPARSSEEVKELASWGCGTTMHVARLVAPRVGGEDQFKDIDFTPAGIRARWQAGYADTRRMVARAPWQGPGGHHGGRGDPRPHGDAGTRARGGRGRLRREDQVGRAHPPGRTLHQRVDAHGAGFLRSSAGITREAVMAKYRADRARLGRTEDGVRQGAGSGVDAAFQDARVVAYYVRKTRAARGAVRHGAAYRDRIRALYGRASPR